MAAPRRLCACSDRAASAIARALRRQYLPGSAAPRLAQRRAICTNPLNLRHFIEPARLARRLQAPWRVAVSWECRSVECAEYFVRCERHVRAPDAALTGKRGRPADRLAAFCRSSRCRRHATAFDPSFGPSFGPSAGRSAGFRRNWHGNHTGFHPKRQQCNHDRDAQSLFDRHCGNSRKRPRGARHERGRSRHRRRVSRPEMEDRIRPICGGERRVGSGPASRDFGVTRRFRQCRRGFGIQRTGDAARFLQRGEC
jgi:hypothetical protein